VQRRKAVGIAVAHVELVRELVDHHVVARHAQLLVGGHRHVFVREDHRPAEPRLAGHRVLREVDDARFVHFLALRGELRRIDDHLRPAVVPLDAELEDQDRGLRRDLDHHEVGDLEVVGAGEVLGGEEAFGDRAQALRCVVIDSAHEQP
jgi:hypothetical protein